MPTARTCAVTIHRGMSVSSPDFEVIAYEVPVAWTVAVTNEGVDGASAEVVTFPVAFLDFSERPEAAELMMSWLAAEGGAMQLWAYYWLWLPLPGGANDGQLFDGPVVEFTIAPADSSSHQGPVPALSFRINAQERGAFMRLATDSEDIGIAALPPADWPEDVEPPEARIITAKHEPNHLLWVELLAWRNSLAEEETLSFQPELPMG